MRAGDFPKCGATLMTFGTKITYIFLKLVGVGVWYCVSSRCTVSDVYTPYTVTATRSLPIICHHTNLLTVSFRCLWWLHSWKIQCLLKPCKTETKTETTGLCVDGGGLSGFGVFMVEVPRDTGKHRGHAAFRPYSENVSHCDDQICPSHS